MNEKGLAISALIVFGILFLFLYHDHLKYKQATKIKNQKLEEYYTSEAFEQWKSDYDLMLINKRQWVGNCVSSAYQQPSSTSNIVRQEDGGRVLYCYRAANTLFAKPLNMELEAIQSEWRRNR